MRSYPIKPPTYLLIGIFLVVILHFVFPVMTLVPSPWTLLGIIPLVWGLVVNLRADQIFHEAATPVCPYEASSALVTSGPYRFTRNPMYLGFTSVLLGVSILAGSLTPFLIAIAFALLMDRMFIRMEEPKLAAAFGAQWEEYKRGTRRWL
ncbi:MAG TPA: isoprenylcysteine carboxylmethyltransferase family protein [Anaerolineales bacterium]|nr:isoprenylcysteine carboxylmethyltransferase family protein [Anaerolineales bacterium]